MAGDETNGWLDDTPVEGDSTGGFPGGGGGIDVRPDGVKLFSTQARGEAQSFQGNFADGVAPLMEQTGRIGSSFQEAAYFTGQHGLGLEKLGLLTQDVQIGMLALGQGAQTIALNYLNADATSAASLPEVLDAFDASSSNGLRAQILDGDGATGPTGQSNPVALPDAEPITAEDLQGGGDDSTIALGDDAEYTVPGDSSNDIEQLDYNDDLAPLEQDHLDDLGQEDYEPAPYDPDDYR